jgi:hypothetical protein
LMVGASAGSSPTSCPLSGCGRGEVTRCRGVFQESSLVMR